MKNNFFTQMDKEQCWISRSFEGQGHDATGLWKATLSVSMKLIHRLMTKLLQKSQTLTQNDKVVKE